MPQTHTIIKGNNTNELDFLYEIEQMIHNDSINFEDKIETLIATSKILINHHDLKICIRLDKKDYGDINDENRKLVFKRDIYVEDKVYGTFSVLINQDKFDTVGKLFTAKHSKFITSISLKLSNYLTIKNLKNELIDTLKSYKKFKDNPRSEWKIIIEMLKKTDQTLFSIISRKMLNNLFTRGISEAEELFNRLGSNMRLNVFEESNRPSKKQMLLNAYNIGNEIFELAAKYFNDEEILLIVQRWMHEEKSNFLIKALTNLNTPLSEISDSLRKYYHMNPGFTKKQTPTKQGLRVSLIRRFLTDQLEYIDKSKHFFEIEDFFHLLQKTIFPSEAHGKLGGKSAGLFLAKKVLEKSAQSSELLSSVKTPKTWFITSDGMKNLMYYNNLEDVIEQKYKDINDIRKEYPYIIQAFKNCTFPTEIMNGLSRALDDFGDNPVIVRSSSLLEDRVGSAFAGKYKSLFLANQGTREERLSALMDAIGEVYASTFGPDPIGYRIERGLLDFNEEMAIMIQEVVGTKVGKYYFPAFAGVAFSYNEFRWSPRIQREDGLIRTVPGLGSRAVDRVGDDYPVLVAPGQPQLRVNQSFEEIAAYSPKFMDVINLATNTFETVSVKQIIAEVGNKFPAMNKIFSIVEGKNIRKPVGLGIDAKKHDIVVTFENLIENTKYVEQLNAMLKELQEMLEVPVDIEFASDGKHLYLLQCRPQASAEENTSAVIPEDVPNDKIVFTANKYISNGKVPNIAYIVYVDPMAYSKRKDLEDLQDIGKAVGKLNKLLPNKTFLLMGPGRWGSRDDIRLGVKVGYSDINNAAMLIEIAKSKGNYTPELSFGTHFFQDLVESNIKYLPLYPDEEEVIFNEGFLNDSKNVLTRFLPEYSYLKDELKLINVRESTDGLVLRILLNADEDQAMAMLIDPSIHQKYDLEKVIKPDSSGDEPLQWRKRMAESIGKQLDAKRFGVKELYLYGTVYNNTADAKSDIDLLVYFEGTEEQKKELDLWFEGWNLSLNQINYNKSGFFLDQFIHVNYITDDNMDENKYYADLMNPANNASQKLSLKN